MPIICCKKMSIFSKNGALMSFFFKLCMKNALLSCTWLVKKRQVCQNYTLLCPKKVNRMIFFPKKNNCFHAHILSKNVNSLKKTSLLSVFCQKNIHSLENTLLMSFFSKIFIKPPTVMPKIGQKTSILSKLHYFMGHKSP